MKILTNKLIKLNIDEDMFKKIVQTEESRLTKLQDTVLTLDKFKVFAHAFSSLQRKQYGSGSRIYMDNIELPEFVIKLLKQMTFNIMVSNAKLDFILNTDSVSEKQAEVETAALELKNSYAKSHHNLEELRFSRMPRMVDSNQISDVKWLIKEDEDNMIVWGGSDFSEYSYSDNLVFSNLDDDGIKNTIITLATGNKIFRGNK